jgi:hypothetical protein
VFQISDTPCPAFAAVVVGHQGAEQWRVLLVQEGLVMKQKDILEKAREALSSLIGTTFDVLTISQPQSTAEIVNLAKIVSKLSPIMGNLIEFKTTDFLNAGGVFKDYGIWKRQDPGFPDVILDGDIKPAPGLEIKAWFPLATEITGRFKDSQTRFANDEVDLAILAWLPEYLFWGKPKIIDVCVVSGRSVAEARDAHYHKPPHYIVLEPEDTAARTSNLQQTNTNGYVIQGNSPKDTVRAREIVASWGENGLVYNPSAEYQAKLKQLQGAVKYRLDTNYAKIDRIEHAEIEAFKSRILAKELFGRTIKYWASQLSNFPSDLAASFLKSDLSTCKCQG